MQIHKCNYKYTNTKYKINENIKKELINLLDQQMAPVSWSTRKSSASDNHFPLLSFKSTFRKYPGVNTLGNTRGKVYTFRIYLVQAITHRIQNAKSKHLKCLSIVWYYTNPITITWCCNNFKSYNKNTWKTHLENTLEKCTLMTRKSRGFQNTLWQSVSCPVSSCSQCSEKDQIRSCTFFGQVLEW